jgi:hypothetical protein
MSLSLVAQVDTIGASDAGMPGGQFIRQVVGWLTWLALYGSVASLLIGAGLWGLGQLGGNAQGATRGKSLAIAGGIGAIVAGVAIVAVNTLFTQARAGA